MFIATLFSLHTLDTSKVPFSRRMDKLQNIDTRRGAIKPQKRHGGTFSASRPSEKAVHCESSCVTLWERQNFGESERAVARKGSAEDRDG